MSRARWVQTARALPGRLLAGAVLWWALSEGDGATAPYGLVAVPLAVAVSVALLPPRRPAVPLHRRLPAVAGLAGWFLVRSVLGGVDVARRAVSRPVDLEPGLVEHRLSLPAGLARVLVADLTSLLPGTLSVELEGDLLVVHVLDEQQPVARQLVELERRVAAAVVGTAPDLR